jgi:hypothetical protein
MNYIILLILFLLAINIGLCAYINEYDNRRNTPLFIISILYLVECTHYIIKSDSKSGKDTLWGLFIILTLICLIVALFLSREPGQETLVTHFTYGLSAPLGLLFIIHFIRYYKSSKKDT